MRKVYTWLPLCAAFWLSSCELTSKKSYDFVAYSNSPVQHGTYLELGFRTVYDDLFYEIESPSGYIYDEATVEILEASFTEAGEYTLIAYDGDRVERRKIFVEVIPDSVSCTPDVNTLRSDVSNVFMDFTNVHGKVLNDDYEISAYSNTGDLYLEFYTSDEPQGNRTYTSAVGGFGKGSEVRVRALTQGAGALYGKTEQSVHVHEENGIRYISLCDFEMTTTGGSFDVLVNAKLKLD